MNKRNFKLALMFSAMSFLVMALTMALVGLVTMILMRLGIISHTRNPGMIIFGFALVSVVLGTFFSRFGSRRMVAPIVEISEATKEVAKGNFDIQLTQRTHAREVNIMADNFRLMVQELANTETFHSDFINNVSHEFKTPLSAIEGYAMLLQKEGLSVEKQTAYLEKILFNTRRLANMTGNILQLSRLENQAINTHRTSFSLDEQLRENILLFEKIWNEKQVELDLDLAAVEYYGNQDLLSQVWQNLLGNAVKYVGPGGTIRVGLQEQAGIVTVSVSDNGPGMSPEVAQRVFDKFYQGDTSHSAEGNGLGLTLAKRIVTLHGGTITVASRLGKGTTFTVMLPAET